MVLTGKVVHLKVDVSTALSLRGCGLPTGTVPFTVCGCPECSPPLCVYGGTQLFPLFGYCEFSSPFSVWVLWGAGPLSLSLTFTPTVILSFHPSIGTKCPVCAEARWPWEAWS